MMQEDTTRGMILALERVLVGALVGTLVGWNGQGLATAQTDGPGWTLEKGEGPTPPGPEFDGQPAEYASAWSAKELCTRIFVAHGDPGTTVQTELRAASALAPGFFIDLAEITVDEEQEMVTVDHPGHPARSAVRAGSQGCVILPAYSGRLHFEPREFPWEGPSANEPWPLGERVWQGESRIDRVLLDAALEAHMDLPGSRSVAVVHKGELVGERYAPGYGPYTPQRAWSATKSVTATLVGIMVDRGLLTLDAPVPVAEWANDERAAITLRNMLNMNSGLRQNLFEGTERSLETFTPQNEHSFIYFDGFNTLADALEAPLHAAPETLWEYRNANVLIAAGLAREAARHAGYDSLALVHDEVFEPLGMRSSTLETDPYGNYIASGQWFTTARDLARLGLLYLQGGEYAGQRILSSEWVNFVRTPAPTSKGYGGFWWLNHDGAIIGVPEDAYWASGAFGQFSLVIPSHDLVIARLGVNLPPMDEIARNTLAVSVIRAVEVGESASTNDPKGEP